LILNGEEMVIAHRNIPELSQIPLKNQVRIQIDRLVTTGKQLRNEKAIVGRDGNGSSDLQIR